MKRTLALLVLISCGAIVGCGTYTTTAKSFVSQLEEHQDVEEVFHWTPIGSFKYPSNRMERVLCTNSKGEQVYLYPDKNTTVKITSKSSNKTFKAYFDTVFYKDGKLYGLRSRIVGGLQRIDVDDIGKIVFKAEIPKTKKVEQVQPDDSQGEG